MRKILATAVVLLLTSQGAFAHRRAEAGPNRRRPPTLRLIYKGEVLQRARPWTYCWSYTFKDGSGVGTCADGMPNYPEAAEVDAPARIAIRIPYPARPTNWFVEAYRLIEEKDGYDDGVGPAEPIDFRIKPHRTPSGSRVWDVVFHVIEPTRHYYIDTGGDLSQGDAFYSFTVETNL